uniref:ShKT domain-containing protein n=1 Tax=Panagrolaimus davidi TaxID=227884 RepID=A0A914QEZ5_9BILA
MFGKIIILSLALLLEVTYAQQCLNISGACVMGSICPTGEQCINDVCCTTDAAANCPNVLPDAFCDAHTAQCTDATLKDAMAKQYPRTCKACAGAAAGTNTTNPGGNGNGTSCVDKVGPNGQSDCVKDAYLCNNAQYYDLMTQQCPKTCGR